MTDFVRKAFMAGVGMTAATFKLLEGELKKLVKLGKLNATEADKILSRMIRSGEKQIQESQRGLEAAVGRILEKSGLARRSEVEGLKKRLAALEKRLEKKRSAQKQR